MGEILFLAHRIPFPPDRGDKIRSHHILKRLAEIGPVHVATFADDAFDAAAEPDLEAVTASYKLVRRTKPVALAGVEAVLKRTPVSLTAFFSKALADYVTDVLAARPISTIYVFSGQMGQYVPRHFSGRVLVDFVDVDSAKFEAYARKKQGWRAWVDAREARLLRVEEATLATRADASLLITDAEAQLFSSRLPESVRSAANVQSLCNGIDSAFFDPDESQPEPRMCAVHGPRIIFTGQMDYTPNIEAALRVMDFILPKICESLPNATFHVVGRNPAPVLSSRHGRDGCYVWGRVDDMRSWLKAADIALVPLDIGRGVQNKVLEAMSMALPAVLTPEAATGIGALDGLQFQIADSDAQLAQATVALLTDARRAVQMGAEARNYVVQSMSWEAALAPLADLVCTSARSVCDAA